MNTAKFVLAKAILKGYSDTVITIASRCAPDMEKAVLLKSIEDKYSTRAVQEVEKLTQEIVAAKEYGADDAGMKLLSVAISVKLIESAKEYVADIVKELEQANVPNA